MGSRTRTLSAGLCLLIVMALAGPVAGAAAGEPGWAENPEHIAAMKAFVAYSGELFKAKMDGSIQYAGTLNGSVNTGTLQSDEGQFLATVASVGPMTSSDDIRKAMDTMKTQIGQFRTDLKTALAAGKGSAGALQTAINSAVTADQVSIQALNTTYWAARETSRMDEFNVNDARRTALLANLTAKGIDVTSAQGIETQIQTLGATLKSALETRNEGQVRDANDQLGRLNGEFLKAIQGLAWQSRETTRLAQFDNTTIRMEDRLANLSAAGVNVSAAQAVLSEITGLRPQLQAALEKHDEAALKEVNSRLASLDRQYLQALRDIAAGERQQRVQERQSAAANRSAVNRAVLNRTPFNSTEERSAHLNTGRRLPPANGEVTR